MNRHLTMTDLLALRAGDADGTTRAHLDGCADCAREYERLAQRIAALRALEPRRAPRNRWPAVRAQVVAERRTRWMRRGALGAVAAAATIAVAVAVREAPEVVAVEMTPSAIEQWQERSRQLEAALAAYDPQGRVVDGRTAALIADLEDRIALVDAGLMQARQVNAPAADVADLWRGRVELMDALVSAHVAPARYVGF